MKISTDSVSFKNNNTFAANGTLILPVPDGYHASDNGSGGNYGWCYIVPNNYSLDDDHINAKPYSFAVTTNPVSQHQFEADKIGAFKDLYISHGIMNGSVQINECVCSAHCGFLYQNWTDTADPTYNKINGFLLTDGNIYQFHIFANHDSGISNDPTTMNRFLSTAISWMEKVCLKDDVPLAGDPNEVKATISDLSNVIEKHSRVIGTLDGFEGGLKKFYATVGGLFYKANNLKIDAEAVRLLSNMIADVDGSPLTPNILKTMIDERKSTIDQIERFIKEYSSSYIVNQFVKCDKLAELNYCNGITIVHYNGIKELLLVLCSENNIHFTSNKFCKDCLNALNDVIQDKWDSTDVKFFPSGAQSRASGSSYSAHTPKWITVSPDDCEIEEYLDRLSEYNGKDEYIRLPDGIAEIGPGAFQYNDTIKGVIIPEGVTEIDYDAFCLCKNLEFVSFPSTLTKIGIDAFKYCEALNRIDIPEEVTEIASGAFEGCSELRHAYIPDSYSMMIDDSAFENCEKLTIHTEKDGNIWEYAKENGIKRDSKAPTKVDIEKIPLGKKMPATQSAKNKKTTANKTAKATEEKIPVATNPSPVEDFEISKKRLIKYNGGDQYIRIPDGITAIASKAFENNQKLISVVVPEGVKRISNDAFVGCSKLERVILPQSIEALSGFRDCRSLTWINIPENVQSIGKNTFSSCWRLENVLIPTSVTKIGESAFFGTNLKDIYLSESLTEIQTDAFRSCGINCILHVHPGSCAEKYAKENKIKFDNETQPYLNGSEESAKGETAGTTAVSEQEKSKKSLFRLIDDDKTLDKYTGNAKNVIVPEGITKLAPFAFSCRRKTNSIALPQSLTEIEKYAFSECDQLQEINLPSSVHSVGEYAFSNCISLKKITWPGSIKTMPDNIFYHCDSLETVVVQEGVTEIGSSLFTFCTSLKNIFLPQSLRKIGDYILLGASKPTLNVYSGSFAEKYAKENNLPVNILLTPEQEAAKKRQEEAEKLRREQEEARRKAEEEERRRKAEEARRKAEEERIAAEKKRREELEAKKKALQDERRSQEQIVAENKGIFGEKARKRKAAQARIAEIDAELRKL